MLSMQLTKRLINILVLLIALTAFTPIFGINVFQNRPVAISVNDPKMVDSFLVSSLLDWVAKNSPYAVLPHVVPDIRFANQTFMDQEWVRRGGDTNVVDEGIRALTVAVGPNRHVIIYLPLDFKWEDYHDRTSLTHELVHFQQYTYKIDLFVECIGDMEYEAYMLALLWFSEQNIEDLAFVEDRLKHVDSYATCS